MLMLFRLPSGKAVYTNGWRFFVEQDFTWLVPPTEDEVKLILIRLRELRNIADEIDGNWKEVSDNGNSS